MKILFVILTCVLYATSAIAQQPQGRYQVFIANESGLATIIRIDTQTGRAWQFFPGMGGKEVRPFWREISTEGRPPEIEKP